MIISQEATSLQLGSCLLGKCPWEVAAWEKAFGKVPNIKENISEILFILIIDDPLFQRLQCPIQRYP